MNKKKTTVLKKKKKDGPFEVRIEYREHPVWEKTVKECPAEYRAG